MPRTDDYVVAYLRYYSGQRPTEPDAGSDGKDHRQAPMIRAEAERAVGLGRKIRPKVVTGPTAARR
jgi:hypothetical protein